MAANDYQVGGDHYKKHGDTGEQHWDRQYRLYGPGYFVGCITKYVERYHDKAGKADLEKAIHFIQKLIELEYPEKISVKDSFFVSPLRADGTYLCKCRTCGAQMLAAEDDILLEHLAAFHSGT